MGSARFADFLTPEDKRAEIIRNLVPGMVLKLWVPYFSTPKYKFAVIVCRAPLILFYVNSGINDYIRQNRELINCQVPISAGDYDFLDRISYIDCTEEAVRDEEDVISQLMSEMNRIKGTLKMPDIGGIRKAVQDNRTLERRYRKLILASLPER